MGCLHARELAASYLPLLAPQKPTPYPPLYPMGVCSQPPATMPNVQNQ